MRVRVVCVHACVLHLFIEERFISGLDVYLFSTNRHCCEILWVNFTNTTSHLLQIFFVLAPPSQKPSTFIGQRISLSLSLALSRPQGGLYFTRGSTKAKKQLNLMHVVRSGEPRV